MIGRSSSFGKRFGGLDGAEQIARINGVDIFFGEIFGGQFGLFFAELGKRRRAECPPNRPSAFPADCPCLTR